MRSPGAAFGSSRLSRIVRAISPPTGCEAAWKSAGFTTPEPGSGPGVCAHAPVPRTSPTHERMRQRSMTPHQGVSPNQHYHSGNLVWSGSASVRCASADAATDSPSGRAVGVIPDASALGSEGSRTLAIQQPVYMGDRIQTGSVGEAQIHFIDDTRLVVG